MVVSLVYDRRVLCVHVLDKIMKMGVELVIYRIRIGVFTMPRKCKYKMDKIVISNTSVSVFLRLLVGLSVVLLMGGDIEMNPGPPRQQSQRTLSFVESPSGTATGNTRSRYANQNSPADQHNDEMKAEVRSDLAVINGKLNDMSTSIKTYGQRTIN